MHNVVDFAVTALQAYPGNPSVVVPACVTLLLSRLTPAMREQLPAIVDAAVTALTTPLAAVTRRGDDDSERSYGLHCVDTQYTAPLAIALSRAVLRKLLSPSPGSGEAK